MTTATIQNKTETATTVLPTPTQPAQQRVAQITEKRKVAMCYTLQDCADLMNVSYLTAWRLVQRGLIHTVPHIRTKLIPRAELERFINSK
jgi:hypothetical protein